jgi:hypothetical protein
LMTMLIHTAVANQLLNGWFWSTMLVLSSKLNVLQESSLLLCISLFRHLTKAS